MSDNKSLVSVTDSHGQLSFGFVAPDVIVSQSGGMVRSSPAGKLDYTMCFDGPMFERLATLYNKGAEVYGARNWMKCAQGSSDDKFNTLDRFRQSALRHFLSWLRGETNEDHAAAVAFNINGYEYLMDNM